MVSGNDGVEVSEEYIISLPKFLASDNLIVLLLIPKRLGINSSFSGKSRIDPLRLLPLASSTPQNGDTPYESESKV